MTESKHLKKIKAYKKIPEISRGNAVFCLMSLFFLAVTLLYPKIAISSMTRGMELCVKTLIPSLFPFMVVSELLVSSGMISIIGGALNRPSHALFGISGSGSCAVLIGMLCGFPIGTKTALSLYEEGRISKAELERLLMLCNIPSSAFLINAVGISLFDSKSVGLLLYFCNVTSAILTGVISKPFFQLEETVCRVRFSAPKKSAVARFTSSITGSAVNMLYICAFVVFFSTLVGTLEVMLASFSLPDTFTPMWFGFFEMTQGVTEASLCSSRQMGILSAAAVTGWSGLSVHFQLMSLCQNHSVSFRPYFISKLLSAVLNFLTVTLALLIFPHLL